MSRQTCSYCQGTKQYFKHKCDCCEGTGVTIDIVQYPIKIPSGVENGQVVAVPIKEENVKGILGLAETEIVYLYVRVSEDPYFQKSDFDVVTEADLSVAQVCNMMRMKKMLALNFYFTL